MSTDLMPLPAAAPAGLPGTAPAGSTATRRAGADDEPSFGALVAGLAAPRGDAAEVPPRGDASRGRPARGEAAPEEGTSIDATARAHARAWAAALLGTGATSAQTPADAVAGPARADRCAGTMRDAAAGDHAVAETVDATNPTANEQAQGPSEAAGAALEAVLADVATAGAPIGDVLEADASAGGAGEATDAGILVARDAGYPGGTGDVRGSRPTRVVDGPQPPAAGAAPAAAAAGERPATAPPVDDAAHDGSISADTQTSTPTTRSAEPSLPPVDQASRSVASFARETPSSRAAIWAAGAPPAEADAVGAVVLDAAVAGPPAAGADAARKLAEFTGEAVSPPSSGAPQARVRPGAVNPREADPASQPAPGVPDAIEADLAPAWLTGEGRGDPGHGASAGPPLGRQPSDRPEAAAQILPSLQGAARPFVLASTYGNLADPVELHVPAAPPDLGPFDGQPHEQIVKAVRLQWQNGIGEARVTLRPEHLGEVTLNLRVEEGRVKAVLRADSATTAEWIRTQQADLQTSLGDQGLELESLEVVVDPEGRRRRPSQTPDAAPRQKRPASDAPRFEVHA